MKSDIQNQNKTKPSSNEPSADSLNPSKIKTSVGFNPETLQKEFQDLVEEKFGGKVQILSMEDSFAFPSEETDSEDTKEPTRDSILNSISTFQYKPREIKNYLDRFVVGQDEAKKALSIAICDHYNHLKASVKESAESDYYQKQNVIILGPTGVGKTYLVRLISDLLGVPFVKADATRFSEVGYMGANVDDIVRDLVQVAGGDKELAAKGIVYVDEVDKLASRRDHTGRDVSGRGVQFGFLRLLENSDVDLNSSQDMASQFKTFMSFQKKGKAEKEIVNTRDILFIFSGAFHGLEEIVTNRMNSKSIGLHQEKKDFKEGEALKSVEARDLVDFGFEHEFIGRLPIRVSCEPLDQEDLFKILTESEHSIIGQYQRSFEHYGIKLSFEDAALKMLAGQAFEQKTGARGLLAVFEELLRPFKFDLPSTKIKELIVTEDLLKNPMGTLFHLLEQ